MLTKELAERLAVRLEGDGEVEITGAAPIETATSADITFVGGRKAFEAAKASSAGCLIAPEEYENAPPRTLLRSPQPRGTFAAAVALWRMNTSTSTHKHKAVSHAR